MAAPAHILRLPLRGSPGSHVLVRVVPRSSASSRPLDLELTATDDEQAYVRIRKLFLIYLFVSVATNGRVPASILCRWPGRSGLVGHRDPIIRSCCCPGLHLHTCCWSPVWAVTPSILQSHLSQPSQPLSALSAIPAIPSLATPFSQPVAHTLPVYELILETTPSSCSATQQDIPVQRPEQLRIRRRMGAMPDLPPPPRGPARS